MTRHSTPSRPRRIVALTLGGLALCGIASAALWADNAPTSVLLGGDFETATVSLRLPGVDRFPLVAGGWGARATAASAVRTSRIAFEGSGSLEIVASAEAPAHVIQDVPLGERSFRLRFAVQRERGRQEVVLVDDWDRTAPEPARPALRLEMAAGAIAVTTGSGSWQLDLRMPPGRWFEIGIDADPRVEQTLVSIDGALVGILPGAPERAPRTIIVGGARGREGSLFRYDAFSLMRLSEIELAELEERVLREAPTELQAVVARLGIAAEAIEMGAPYLAIPELRAASRLLDRSVDARASRGALEALIALLEQR
jgi:hypothetical protein